ncbi:MAG: ABC transporter permease subunit/CPBP intramembrane protease [Pirellulaceae bacterium]
MTWTNVKLIYSRELRDQLRDRRTLFTIVVLPLLLYPLMGMCLLQMQQFLREHASQVRVIGAGSLPADPALIDGATFSAQLCAPPERKLLHLETVAQAGHPLDELRAETQADIEAGRYDAVVYFPPDFADRLAQFRGTLPPAGSAESHRLEAIPQPEILHDTANEKSKVARDRVENVLRRWRELLVEDNLRERQLPAATAKPFEVVSIDVAEEGRRRAAIWSKILPFILMVWALTGAFYPAIDLCAGEKERGTLETLLSSPAQRSEIVWGKLLTVMTFSMATALLNLIITTGMASFVITQLESMGPAGTRMNVGSPPLASLLWLVLALPPIAALFSALSLAIAAFARSSKEGQYYLMPLLMVSLPLMMLPLLPTTELDLGFALIPISGLMLLLRTLIEGQYLEALRYSVPVIGVTAACCLLAIRWAIDQFNNESVLFRESERLDLGLWIRHLVRDRLDTPTVGEAILCGVLILVIRFFSNFLVPVPRDWAQFATTTLVLQVALIATPACLMAIMLTRKPLKTLSLGGPSFLAALPGAALLAACLHPAMFWLGQGIQHLYPISPAIQEQLQQLGLEQYIQAQPLWQVLLLIAVTPAICEELAFRGFILSGLRRMGHKWGAIVLCSVFFGMAHGMLQQSLAAGAVGVVIGYVVVKTGSLWPGVLYHLVHNGLAVLQTRVSPELIQSQPLLRMLFEPSAEGGAPFYSVPATIVLAACGLGVLWWLKTLPYHQSAEERLQAALDQQIPLPAKAPA